MARPLDRIRYLYEGSSPTAHKFRYALLIFDLATIAFVVATSFIAHSPVIEVIDFVLGLIILADFLARMAIERTMRCLMRPATWADIAAIISFLAPVAGEGFAFLRVLRTLRLFHTYQLMVRLRRDFRYFRTHEEIIRASVNMLVFLFVTTGLIYALQYNVNPLIRNYADALYFTVTTLTTTGFGDITLSGTAGRLLSVAVMIIGVTLFLRLAQVIFRPRKVRFECQVCGLRLHDADAIHCKHCGTVVHIETEGNL